MRMCANVYVCVYVCLVCLSVCVDVRGRPWIFANVNVWVGMELVCFLWGNCICVSVFECVDVYGECVYVGVGKCASVSVTVSVWVGVDV